MEAQTHNRTFTEILDTYPFDDVAELLKKENLQIVSVILSELPIDLQRKVIGLFPYSTQSTIIAAFQDLRQVSSDIRDVIFQSYYDALHSLTHSRDVYSKEILQDFQSEEIIKWFQSYPILTPSILERLTFFEKRLLYMHRPWLENYTHYIMLVLSMTCIYRLQDLQKLKVKLSRLQEKYGK